MKNGKAVSCKLNIWTGIALELTRLLDRKGLWWYFQTGKLLRRRTSRTAPPSQVGVHHPEVIVWAVSTLVWRAYQHGSSKEGDGVWHIVAMPGSLETINGLIWNSVMAEKVEASTSALSLIILNRQIEMIYKA